MASPVLWYIPSAAGCPALPVDGLSTVTFPVLLLRACSAPVKSSCVFARNDLEQWKVALASSVAVTTAGYLRTSVCRVVIYLQRDMSGDSCLPQHHTQSDCTSPPPPLACPKTETCSYRGALGLGNKYVRLNVGGNLFYTTLHVLTRQNSMLKAMFSGQKEVFTDKEGKPFMNCRHCFTVTKIHYVLLFFYIFFTTNTHKLTNCSVTTDYRYALTENMTPYLRILDCKWLLHHWRLLLIMITTGPASNEWATASFYLKDNGPLFILTTHFYIWVTVCRLCCCHSIVVHQWLRCTYVQHALLFPFRLDPDRP